MMVHSHSAGKARVQFLPGTTAHTPLFAGAAMVGVGAPQVEIKTSVRHADTHKVHDASGDCDVV